MSRWLPERISISLSPHRAVVAQVGRWPRLRVTGKRIVECAEPATDKLWEAPLRALDSALADSGISKRSAMVVLSNHFVRYALVPWRDAVTNRDERMELARHCFGNIYGKAAQGWEIRLSDGGFRRNAVASAIDTELLEELRKVMNARGIELDSVQPCFMRVCNRFRKELGLRDRSCLAVLENGRVTLGVFDSDGWRVFAARRILDSNPNHLSTVIAQELQSAGQDTMPDAIHVMAMDGHATETMNSGGAFRMLRLKALRGFSPIEDARCAMAVCGVAR